MANLPQRPQGNLPSLNEARSAHLQPQSRSRMTEGSSPDTVRIQCADSTVHQALRFDPNTHTFQQVDSKDDVIAAFVPESPQGQAFSMLPGVTTNDKPGYTLRKRKAAEPDADAQDHSARKRARVVGKAVDDAVASEDILYSVPVSQGEPSRKRARPDYGDDDDIEEGEIVFSDDLLTVDGAPPAKKRKKNKHKPHSRKKAKSQVMLEMEPMDLVPHYRPDKKLFAKLREERLAKDVVRKPTTFTDLNEDCRRIIFEKVSLESVF